MAQSSRPLSRHLSPIASRKLLNPSFVGSPALLRRDLQSLPPIKSSGAHTSRTSLNNDVPALPHRPMSNMKKSVLRKNSLYLKNNLDFEEDGIILHYLYSQEILSQENYDAIKRCQSRGDQVHKFLKMLEKKGDNAFDEFLKSLQEEEGYKHIRVQLESDLAKEMSHGEKTPSSWRNSAIYRTPSISKFNDLTPLHTQEENPTYIVKQPTFASIVSKDSKDELEIKLNKLYEALLDQEQYEELPESYETYQRVPIDSGAKINEHNFTMPEMIQEFLVNEKELSENSHLILCDELSELIWEITNERSQALAYDYLGNMLLVSMNTLKRQGNAIGEKWYYPITISSHQIGIWLSQTKFKGCFYVYTSTNSFTDGKHYAPYNLSLCHSESGDVTHYRIEQNENNELVIGDVQNANGMRFQNIHILVEYFKLNRGCLPCRLRWAPSEIDNRMHFDVKIQPSDLEIMHNEELSNSPNINQTSKVFKGRYDGKFVAVKIPTECPLNRIKEDDFLSEAAILLKIKHTNIRNLIGVSFKDKTPHLILEHTEKSNLKQCLSDGSIDKDPWTIINAWVQILQGLDYLAKMNFIIHRDVAARNCLVQSAEALHIQLSDFGMAVKVIQYDEYLGDEEEMFAVRWAAPEVLKENRFSTKSDIWAAAVLFWEIASGGGLPYSKIPHEKVPEKIISGKNNLGFDETMDSSYKAIFKEIISPCWKKCPEQRPTADDCIALCNKHLDSIAGTDTIYASGKSFGGPQIRKSGKGRRSLRGLKDFIMRKK